MDVCFAIDTLCDDVLHFAPLYGGNLVTRRTFRPRQYLHIPRLAGSRLKQQMARLMKRVWALYTLVDTED